MLKKQRTAVILVAVAILVLLAALLAVKYFIEIYQYPDVDGKEYNIKKFDGVYELCYKNGTKVHKTEEGYYQTDAGTLVQIDPTKGSYSVYAVVDTYATEEEYYGTNILLFAGMTYNMSSQTDTSKQIHSLEIFNSHGSFAFERVKGNNFKITGTEGVSHDNEKFASLAFSCGQPIAFMRLENPQKLSNGSIDLAEYGLAEETRTQTVTDKDGNETEEEYLYKPAYFVITAENGDSHRIIIGDKTVTGSGRYALYDYGETYDKNGNKTVWQRRDTVYVIDNSVNVLGYSGIEDLALGRIEDLASPAIVYPSTLTDYFNVREFRIYKNIDFDAREKALEEKYGDADDESIDPDEFWTFYNKTFEEYSDKPCHFSYVDLEEREGTMDAHQPYVSDIEYVSGYYIHSLNVDTVLYALHDTDFTRIEKLNPTDEDFEKYGLSSAAYVIAYYYTTTDEKGNEVYIDNYVEISEKNEDGVFYAYSSTYDMIVGVSESSFGFLEWEEIKWYSENYIQLDISHVTDIKVESPSTNVHFQIEDSASKQLVYLEKSGDLFFEGNVTYTVRYDSKSGKYVLMNNGQPLTPQYKGDYLVTPLVYSAGKNESDGYMFAESKMTDLDGDGNKESAQYYFYNVSYHPTTKEYYLVAQIILADSEGNRLADDQYKYAESALKTQYYVTNSGYMYIVNEDSYIGSVLDEKYTQYKRGKWCTGNLFVTADGKYILVNAATGEWCEIDDVSCGIYFCDSKESRLAQRSVHIEAKYKNGKLTRYEETYYPLTEENLLFDEETGAIQVYNTKNKSWDKAPYEDCTIGIWNTGAYYVTEGGNIFVVNEETGDWGTVTASKNEIYIADIFADGKLLDYVIKATNHIGRPVDANALDNFQSFYSDVLYASFEGMADLTEEEKADLRKLDSFSGKDADPRCQLKLTVLSTDFYGNRHDVVIRFYQYSERKSYVTIESVGPDGKSSGSETAYGNFYVLRSFVDQLIEDAYRVANGDEVDSVR